jgi:hypothetical protein
MDGRATRDSPFKEKPMAEELEPLADDALVAQLESHGGNCDCFACMAAAHLQAARKRTNDLRLELEAERDAAREDARQITFKWHNAENERDAAVSDNAAMVAASTTFRLQVYGPLGDPYIDHVPAEARTKIEDALGEFQRATNGHANPGKAILDRLKAMEDALKWYADPDNWDSELEYADSEEGGTVSTYGDAQIVFCNLAGGETHGYETARAALKGGDIG